MYISLALLTKKVEIWGSYKKVVAYFLTLEKYVIEFL